MKEKDEKIDVVFVTLVSCSHPEIRAKRGNIAQIQPVRFSLPFLHYFFFFLSLRGSFSLISSPLSVSNHNQQLDLSQTERSFHSIVSSGILFVSSGILFTSPFLYLIQQTGEDYHSDKGERRRRKKKNIFYYGRRRTMSDHIVTETGKEIVSDTSKKCS